jgi:hypothetical protein
VCARASVHIDIHMRNWIGVFLQSLEELNLSRTSLGDDDMKELLHLRLLRTLILDDQKSLAVGDEGLRLIASLPNLARLSLMSNCDITSIGLKYLEMAPRLTSIEVSGSVDANVAQALRSLQVHHSQTTENKFFDL